MKYKGNFLERRRQASKAWRENHPDRVLNKRYKERYGITLDEYNVMLKDQNHKCYLCGIDEVDAREGKLCVDHCHTSGKVRKLLCHNCNCGLGNFQDNPDVLEKAVKYLRNKS